LTHHGFHAGLALGRQQGAALQAQQAGKRGQFLNQPDAQMDAGNQANLEKAAPIEWMCLGQSLRVSDSYGLDAKKNHP
jgi:hypothetical protein